jgi:UDP-N-acetylmuramoylalanine--D-glutamate ligase
VKVAILGYELEGRAALRYWQKLGAEVTVCDQDAAKEVPADVPTQLGPDYLKNLARFDVLVRTPYLKPRDILAANPAVSDKITTGVNEFLRASPTANTIGITGTKGKGTTSTLITKMLEASGKRVHLLGNIGVAALDQIDNVQPDDWVVLELSSYQLIDIKHSPHIAACLMVVPEHLDWHIDMAEYIAAKQQLFRWQQADDITVYYNQNERSKEITSVSQAKKIPYFESPGAYVDGENIVIDGKSICKVSELKLIGEHNWQNVCAATTVVWQVTQDIEAIRSVLTSFAGLPYRIEFRREANGIRYYNDSFATGPGATMAALRAIPETKVMIMGGYDRGLDLTELAIAIKKSAEGIRSLLLIGASAQRLGEILTENGYDNFKLSDAQDMTRILKEATELAQPGDAVVLSPAFASYGMFKNFEERGKAFNEAVETL